MPELVWFPDDLIEQVASCAERDGMSVHEWIRVKVADEVWEDELAPALVAASKRLRGRGVRIPSWNGQRNAQSQVSEVAE